MISNESKYAESPSLHPGTGLGHVHLKISNLERSLDFYQRAVGLALISQSGNQAQLGAGGRILLSLSEIPGAVRIPRRSGLYHFAILTPSRRALGKSLRNLIDTGTDIQGGADHLVSEAIYLADPDGNGIEIYRDRPRSEWPIEDGQIIMATDPLDFQGILEDIPGNSREWDGLEVDTRLGHVHLHVADLEDATNFYTQILGFDFIMNYMDSAAFLSAGGYHHHIGLNTWNGIGAPPNPVNAVGLGYFTINLQGGEENQSLVARLERADWPYERTDAGIMVRDPSGNGIILQVAA